MAITGLNNDPVGQILDSNRDKKCFNHCVIGESCSVLLRYLIVTSDFSLHFKVSYHLGNICGSALLKLLAKVN